MLKFKVLIQGYVYKKDDNEYASCSTTLIQDANKNIIVDPGLNREKLLNSLKKEVLGIGDIQYVILTHSHADHSLLAGAFYNARILDNDTIYSWNGKIEEHNGGINNTDIEIFSTPGHDQFHCSVLFKDSKLGNIVVAGDVFWWADDEKTEETIEEMLKHKDPYMKDEKALLESRKKILEKADWIIPGHGKMFKKPPAYSSDK